jgi:hypothetical protein
MSKELVCADRIDEQPHAKKATAKNAQESIARFFSRASFYSIARLGQALRCADAKGFRDVLPRLWLFRELGTDTGGASPRCRGSTLFSFLTRFRFPGSLDNLRNVEQARNFGWMNCREPDITQ